MRSIHHIGYALAVFAAGLLAAAGPAPADTGTDGGNAVGVRVREKFKIHQNKFNEGATDLHFKLWQKEDNIDLNGWDVQISGFTNSNSGRSDQPAPYHDRLDNHPDEPPTNNPDNGQHAVDVSADGANIPFCTWVTVDAAFWMTSKNTKRIADVNWTRQQAGGGQQAAKAVANHGWFIDDPTPHPTMAGYWCHLFELANDEPLGGMDLEISNLRFWALPSTVADLDEILDPTYQPQQVGSYFTVDHLRLTPEQSWAVCIATDQPYWGGYLYGAYDIHGSPEVIASEVFEHPVPVPAPGAAAMLVPALGAVVLLRRRRDAR